MYPKLRPFCFIVKKSETKMVSEIWGRPWMVTSWAIILNPFLLKCHSIMFEFQRANSRR